MKEAQCSNCGVVCQGKLQTNPFFCSKRCEAHFTEVAEQQSRITALEKSNTELREALGFYADPDNYFAIAFLIDRPAGGFADDFSEDESTAQYSRPMPGKLARDTLAQQPTPRE